MREIGDGPKSSILAQLAHFYRLLDTIAPVLACAPIVHSAVSTPSPHSTLVPGLHRYGDHVTHAIALLHDRLEARWTLAALAGEVQLSSSQLVRTFRVDTGMPPMAYLQRIRAERMAYLLRTTDLSVAAIGRAVGWDDPSHASRRFTAHWRTSPASYRAQLG